MGLGFVALGLGALQIVLDKGQREDWFDSHFILVLAVIAAASLIFVVYLGVETERPHHRSCICFAIARLASRIC